MNFPFICSNIATAPAYGVFISQMIRYSRACGSYQDLLDIGLMLTRMLLNQGFLLVDRYGISVSQMTTICSTCRKHFPVLSSFTTYHRICNQIKTTGATSGAGTAYPSGAPEFTPGFQWGSCYSIFSFIGMFCRSLFVLLYFFFWPMCFLFYFDIRFLIVSLVSSSSS